MNRNEKIAYSESLTRYLDLYLKGRIDKNDLISALEEVEMDYLEKMRLKFHFLDLVAEEELKQFLDEMEADEQK